MLLITINNKSYILYIYILYVCVCIYYHSYYGSSYNEN